MRQLYPPLLRGGAVEVLSDETVSDPRALLDALAAYERVSFGGAPSLWAALVELMETGEAVRPAGLRVVLLGGDGLPDALALRTRALFPGIRLWNHYGPTEATVNVPPPRAWTVGRVNHRPPHPQRPRCTCWTGAMQPVPAGRARRAVRRAAPAWPAATWAAPALTAERVRPRPVRRPARRADVPHGRPRAVAGGRRAGVSWAAWTSR